MSPESLQEARSLSWGICEVAAEAKSTESSQATLDSFITQHHLCVLVVCCCGLHLSNKTTASRAVCLDLAYPLSHSVCRTKLLVVFPKGSFEISPSQHTLCSQHKRFFSPAMQRDSGNIYPSDIFSRNSAPRPRSYMESASNDGAAAPAASSQPAVERDTNEGDSSTSGEVRTNAPLASSLTSGDKADKPKPKRKRKSPLQPWKVSLPFLLQYFSKVFLLSPFPCSLFSFASM